MKTFVVGLGMLLGAIMAHAEVGVPVDDAQRTGSGNNNSNNTIVIKPQINVHGCCQAQCSKPKTRTIVKVVEKPVTVEKVVYVNRVVVKRQFVEKARKKNRISLLGGAGPTKLEQPSASQVNLVRGPVGGAMYQRSLNDSLSLGVQVQTNQTVLGIVGLDF